MLQNGALRFLLLTLIAAPVLAEDRAEPVPFEPDAQFWLDAAIDDLEQGLHAEARRAATEAIRLRETRGYYVRAVVALKKKEMERALDDCNRALEAEKDEKALAAALGLRAVIHLELNHVGEAIADYDRLIKIDPHCLDYFEKRCACHCVLRDWNSALKDAVHVVDARPDDSEGYSRRARIRAIQTQYRLAIIDYKRAAELCRDDEKFVGLVAALITCPVKEFNDFEGAIELVRKRCDATEWKDSLWISLLASVHAEAADFSHAIEYAKRAVALATGDDFALAEHNLQFFTHGKTLSVFSGKDMWTDAWVPKH